MCCCASVGCREIESPGGESGGEGMGGEGRTWGGGRNGGAEARLAQGGREVDRMKRGKGRRGISRSFPGEELGDRYNSKFWFLSRRYSSTVTIECTSVRSVLQ